MSLFVLFVLVILAFSAIRVVQQYERGIIFVPGRLRSDWLTARRLATTLPANADRDRGGEEFDYRFPTSS